MMFALFLFVLAALFTILFWGVGGIGVAYGVTFVVVLGAAVASAVRNREV